MVADVNGVRLYYEKLGEGLPLIMLHGNGEDHTIFDAAAAALRSRFCCYLIDSRGHGLSTQTQVFHYREMAQDVLAFIDALDLEHVRLLGFSDGGILGLIAAAKSEKIERLVVCGANTKPGGLTPEALGDIRRTARLHPSPLADLMLKEPDIQPRELSEIRAHTLILAGQYDVVREAHTRAIADAIPRNLLKILPGETHSSYVEHSTKIAKLVADFCR